MDCSELPWPECLGTFDEEACRYFLLQIGEHVVPHYPFSFGMEEVYAMAMEHYGESGIADVMSVLQELLEDDNNACGFGDDGDVWRSWRHSWRHRNNDLKNPFVPRVGSRILPRPTPARIRQLKKENHVRCIIQQVDQSVEPHRACSLSMTSQVQPGMTTSNSHSHPYPKQPTEALTNETMAVGAPEACKTAYIATRISEGRIQHEKIQDSDVVDSVESLDLSAGLLLSLQALKSLEPFNIDNPNAEQQKPEESHGEIVISSTLDRFPSPPLATACTDVMKDRTAAASIPFSSATNILQASLPTPRFARRADGSRSTSTLQDVQCVQNKTSVVGETGSPALVAVSNNNTQQRHINRKVRLVNGTIFSPQTGRSGDHDRAQTVEEPADRRESKCSLIGLRSIPAWLGHGHRGSWIQSIKLAFISNHHQTAHPDHQKGCSVFSACDTPAASHLPESDSLQAAQSSTAMRTRRIQRRRHFGLDGAADAESGGSTCTGDLNKPLPLSPGDALRSILSRSDTSSTTSQPLPSTASTFSSSMSRKSVASRDNMQMHDPVPAMALGPHELAPIQENEKDNRATCDPSKSPLLPRLPVSYEVIASGNPFTDELRPALPIESSLPLEHGPHQNHARNAASRALPASQSEPTLQFATNTPPTTTSFHLPLCLPGKHRKLVETRADMDNADEQESYAVSSSPQTLVQKQDTADSPIRRPRSPIKRLLNIRKGDHSGARHAPQPPVSLATSRPYQPPKTPTGNKKSSVKKWGDRLRYGFLTSDQEQVQQEELLEQYSVSTENTPPSSKSKFSISLEPPYQAKIYSEVELIVTVTTNRFLLRETKAKRVSPESIGRLEQQWQALSRPQVVQFHYDQMTQRDLIVANLRSVKFYGDGGKDPLQINSTLHGWRMMAKDLMLRTFCFPDSVVRKHLHDAHRVLELLGAPGYTFLAFEDMQIKTLTRINLKQQERLARRTATSHLRSLSDGSRLPSDMIKSRNTSGSSQAYEYTMESFQLDNVSLAPSPSPTPRCTPRKATGADGAIMSLSLPKTRAREKISDQYDYSRGGRLGKAIREKPEHML